MLSAIQENLGKQAHKQEKRREGHNVKREGYDDENLILHLQL